MCYCQIKTVLVNSVFQAFQDSGQRFGGVVSVVMEKDCTSVFNLACNTLANTVGRSVIFPIKIIPILYSWKCAYNTFFIKRRLVSWNHKKQERLQLQQPLFLERETKKSVIIKIGPNMVVKINYNAVWVSLGSPLRARSYSLDQSRSRYSSLRANCKSCKSWRVGQ